MRRFYNGKHIKLLFVSFIFRSNVHLNHSSCFGAHPQIDSLPFSPATDDSIHKNLSFSHSKQASKIRGAKECFSGKKNLGGARWRRYLCEGDSSDASLGGERFGFLFGED